MWHFACIVFNKSRSQIIRHTDDIVMFAFDVAQDVDISHKRKVRFLLNKVNIPIAPARLRLNRLRSGSLPPLRVVMIWLAGRSSRSERRLVGAAGFEPATSTV